MHLCHSCVGLQLGCTCHDWAQHRQMTCGSRLCSTFFGVMPEADSCLCQLWTRWIVLCCTAMAQRGGTPVWQHSAHIASSRGIRQPGLRQSCLVTRTTCNPIALYCHRL